MQTLNFADMLALIEDRSAAMRGAAAEAGFDAQVPGCPDWTVADLLAHVGRVQLFWTAVVAAGEALGPPDDESVGDTEPHVDLLACSPDPTVRLFLQPRHPPPPRPPRT